MLAAAPPVPPDGPLIPAGQPVDRRALDVIGITHLLAADCSPRWNDIGTGSFTARQGVAVDSEVTFRASGVGVFEGLASKVTRVVRGRGDANAQVYTVEVDGLLTEWENARVLPDFGASDLDRLGPPSDDTRNFGWTMNGLGTDQGAGEEEFEFGSSVSGINHYGTIYEVFPLPDAWPDPLAKWMWVDDPMQLHQPAGWCYFREVLPAAGTIQVWCVAFDYAEVQMDGVPLLTCQTPGRAERITIDVRDDFHLLTVAAHNRGGKAGLLISVIDVTDGTFGEVIRRSSGGWRCLAYPQRTFRLNPGQVLRRLLAEAKTRGVKGVSQWSLTCNASADSAGRPWPENEEITVAVGTSYMDVLRQLGAGLIDFAPSATGRTLHVFRKGEGTGRAAADPLTNDVDVVSRTVTTQVR